MNESIENEKKDENELPQGLDIYLTKTGKIIKGLLKQAHLMMLKSKHFNSLKFNI